MTDTIEMLDWRFQTRKGKYGRSRARAFGQVRNNSDQMLSSVSIEGVFRDGEGRLVDVGDDTLFDVAPGTIRNFEIDFFDAPAGAKGKCDFTNVRWDVEEEEEDEDDD